MVGTEDSGGFFDISPSWKSDCFWIKDFKSLIFWFWALGFVLRGSKHCCALGIMGDYKRVLA